MAERSSIGIAIHASDNEAQFFPNPGTKRPPRAENGVLAVKGGSTMRGSNLIWTIVGILIAIALIIWIVSAI